MREASKLAPVLTQASRELHPPGTDPSQRLSLESALLALGMLYAAWEMFQRGEEHGGRDEHSAAFWSALDIRAGGRDTAQSGNDGSEP